MSARRRVCSYLNPYPYPCASVIPPPLPALPSSQNYLFKYIQGIERVEQRDVARAAAARLHPERQAVVVVGDREVVQPSLEAAGFQVLPMRLED